jgi:cysteine-rich repeat protein
MKRISRKAFFITSVSVALIMSFFVTAHNSQFENLLGQASNGSSCTDLYDCYNGPCFYGSCTNGTCESVNNLEATDCICDYADYENTPKHNELCLGTIKWGPCSDVSDCSKAAQAMGCGGSPSCINGGCECPTGGSDDPPDDPCATMNCDDSDACTTDSCTNGICSSEPKDCSDGNECTTDSCANGACQNPAKDCSDDNACTTDSCNGGACSNQPKDCSDNDACTTDSCSNGACSNQPKDCSDGNECTIDSCANGACQHPAKDCSDNDVCTLDYCGIDGCFYAPNIGDARCNSGNPDSDDGDPEDPPPTASSSAASSVSSCLANQSDAGSPAEMCNVCDPPCSLECMCGLGYPGALDMTDPASVTQWQFASNTCARECDEDVSPPPPTSPNPTPIPPDIPPFSSAGGSSANSSASSSCPEGKTLCTSDMYITCACGNQGTHHACSPGECFACPVCPSSQSSVSSDNNSSFTIDMCRLPGHEQAECSVLQKFADKYAEGPVEVSDECVGKEEVCTGCRFASWKDGCFRFCLSISCEGGEFHYNNSEESCSGGSCPVDNSCAKDSDCPQPICAGCRYDADRDQCNIQCNSMVCRNDECVVLLEPVIACDDCDSCKSDETPSCDSGKSAYCCPNSSWKCLSDSVSPDMADEFICNPVPDDDDDPSSSFSSESKFSRLSVTSIASVGSTNSDVISSDQAISSEDFISSIADTPVSSADSSLISVAAASSIAPPPPPPTYASSTPEAQVVSSAQNFVSEQSSVSTIIAAQSSVISLILTLEDSSSTSSTTTSDSSVGNTCGDGFLQQGEECDDGNLGNNDSCSDVCTHKSASSFCGNSIVNTGEECDDGNFLAGDGCTPFCTIIRNDDNGDGDNDDGITNNASDEDDDGNGDEDDGVRNNQFDDDNGDGDNDDGTSGNQRDLIRLLAEKKTLVAAASICGNGILDVSEECDDTNRRDEDGCSSTCLLEIGICGDGVVQTLLDEQCEGSDACVNCRFVSVSCGDGKVDTKEECDDGPLNSTSSDAHCRPDCSMSRCGDGILDSTEICDDGNRLNGDGCDRYCRIEESDIMGVSVIASDNTVTFPDALAQVASQNQLQQYPYQNQFNQQPSYSQFPQYPNYQQLPYQLPLAQLQPLIAPQGIAGDTGPAAVAVAASGMAAGLGWARRRRRR